MYKNVAVYYMNDNFVAKYQKIDLKFQTTI